MNTRRFIVLLAAFLVGGCGSPAGDSGPNKTDDAAKLKTATEARSYFDKVQGNYESLSAEDKAAYVKLLGGDKAADELWNTMKASGAASRATNPAGTAPNGTTVGPR